MRKFQFIILLLFMAAGAGAQSYFDFKLENNKCYKAGERLEYSIKFGPVSAGTATIGVNKKLFDKEVVYHAKIFARTKGLAERIYRVRDTYESYIDLNTMMPLMAVQNLKEGDYRFYTEMHFDPTNDSVYSMKSDSTYSVPHNTVDMVTLLYYLRSMNLDDIREGEVLDINIFFDEEVLPFDIRYRGIETVSIASGTYRCHRFDPKVIVGREFQSEDDMTVYLSADGNYLPVRVKFNLKIGSIKCDLLEAHNIRYPLQKLD